MPMRILLKKVLLLLILTVAVTMVFAACKKESAPEAFDAEKEMAKTIATIEALELLANEYFEEDVFLNTLIFLRCRRYSDGVWALTGGALDEGFEEYVLSAGESFDYLRNMQRLIIPSTGDAVDFVHMIAAMNLALKGRMFGDLGGFAGDITQLVNEIIDVSGDDEALFLAASALCGNESSGFGAADIYADIDAVNIIADYEETDRPFSVILKDYYEDLTKPSRMAEYLLNEYGKTQFVTDELGDLVYERVTDNIPVIALLAKDGITVSTYGGHIKACCYAFAEYILRDMDQDE